MGLLTTTRKRAKRQASTTYNLDEVIERIDSRTYGPGAAVNSYSAVRQSTVWACVRIISETIAQLPIDVQTRQNGNWVRSEMHDAYGLLARPNEFMHQHDLIQFLVSWSELQGNALLFKAKDSGGRVRTLLPIEAASVAMHVEPRWRVRYHVTQRDGLLSGEFLKDQIFHLRNFGTNAFWGLSTIGAHREGIGLAMDLETHASRSYKNGLHANKWIEFEGSRQQAEDLKSELQDLQGAVNSGKMPILAKAKFHEFQRMSAVDAQYIESRKLQNQQIAAIFGVPLFLLNDTEKSTSWGTGLEQLSRAFIRFSLRPRLNRLSHTLLREIIPDTKQRTTRFVFDTDQFTLGEFRDRMEGYKVGREAGVLSVNEARELEGRNPIDGGDTYGVQTNEPETD